MNLQRLREKVLEDIYPSTEETEEMEEKYQKISSFIQKEFGRETHFAGSASRGTCMKGDRDIDIFVLFPEETTEKELENKGLKIGKKVFEKFDGDYEIEYAEHPYTKGEIGENEVEIVPCYDASPEDIKSSVDRTPHHSRWVQENLDEEQRKDVVLLKKFLDAAGIYGSSLKIRGFSGYLCETLIAEYGSFGELVEEATSWSENQIIDPEEHHENLPEELEEKFEDENLTVIDPVDPERNVASVLSRENYAKFIYLCWKFQNSPGIDFFQREEEDYTQFEIKQEIKDRNDFIVIEFDKVDEVDDIVYPQMRKTLRRLEKGLEKKEFRIFNSGFHIGNRTRIFFEVDRKLPETREMKGPKVFHGEDHLEQFTSKYDNVYIKGDRIYAKTKREFSDAKNYLKDFLSGDLEGKGIPSQVAEEIQDYSFGEAAPDDQEWLNYLGQKLNVEKN